MCRRRVGADHGTRNCERMCSWQWHSALRWDSLPAFGAKMQILGDAFIKAIRVVHRASDLLRGRSLDRAHVRHGPGRPRSSQGNIYFEVLTTVALIIGLVMVNVLKPGVGMNVDLSKVDTSSVQS